MNADKKYYDRLHGEYIEVSEQVNAVCTTGKRKSKYVERDLKVEKLIVNQKDRTVTVIPSREISLDYLLDEVGMEFPATLNGDTEEAVLRILEADRVRKAIRTLPPVERSIVFGKYWEGFTERQLADKLGIAQSSVHYHLQRAYEKLKNILKNF